MPRLPASDANVRSLVDGFVNRLAAAIEVDASNRARQMMLSALSGGTVPRRRGRPPKYAKYAKYTTFASVPSVGALSAPAARRPAKKRPKQFCPMPGCTNVAAPVFGMVCAKHKDVPRSVINKHRQARKAARAGSTNGISARAKAKRRANANKKPRSKKAATKAKARAKAKTRIAKKKVKARAKAKAS